MRSSARLFAVLVTLLLAGCLAACGDGPEPVPDPPSWAFVLGGHANSPAVVLTAADVAPAVDAQGQVTMVEADGAPFVAVTADLRTTAANGDARAVEKKRFTSQLVDASASIAPRTPEVDLLAAVDLAARSLTGPDRHLVVIDSGLSTHGLLRFQQPGMLDAAADEVAAQVEAHDGLQALQGVDVTLRGTGDTSPPQQALTPALRTNLLGVWVATLEAAGATVTVDDRPRTGDAPAAAPTVTTVPVPDDTIDLPVPESPTSSPKPPVVPPLPAAQLFTPGSADLVDSAALARRLRPLAEYLVTSGRSMTCLGTTARWGTRSYQIDLGSRRAAAVCGVVAGLGVDAHRLRSTSNGSDFDGYVDDQDPAGGLLPGPAALNRTVRFVVGP